MKLGDTVTHSFLISIISDNNMTDPQTVCRNQHQHQLVIKQGNRYLKNMQILLQVILIENVKIRRWYTYMYFFFGLQFDGDNKSATGSRNVKYGMQIHQTTMPVLMYEMLFVCQQVQAQKRWVTLRSQTTHYSTQILY
jgi:hypothetical protein